jgi:structural maintenance of chromosome 3 (chondroitin sulfate proteoglycan 6)
LRRTIGLKKDEFFLQRKRTAKNEIQSLLEGAGFSKSNPYFIVQQGKVQDLCTMSDAARLRLLKEVAGTTVYDEKKAESIAKMEENSNSIAKITEMLTNIEERLQELNAEKDELTAYQQLDRERRAAQYGLYSLELQKARTQLDQIEHDHLQHVETVSKLHEAAKVTHDAIRHTEAVLKTKGSQLRRTRQTVSSLEDDKKQAVTVYTKLDLECKELQDSVMAGDELAKSNQKKLAELEQEIAKAERELADAVAPAYDQAFASLQEMNDQRDTAVKQTEALYAKQGRGRMFRTVQERDAFLLQSSQELEAAKTEKESELSNQRDTLANLRRTVEKEITDVKALQQDVTKRAATQQSLSKSIDEKGRQRLELNEARRENWRKTEELQEQVREARETTHSCLSDTKKVMPRATAMGIEALRSIIEQEGLVQGEQYFGMLMENMQLTDVKYQTAVEVAAQNSLFHVIVDNDHTAARLMKRLEDGKLGRVTFLPLNQLRIDPVKYPDSNDVRPMLGLCIQYDKKVERAMQHVFSKKMVARSQELASEWSTKLSVDAITLDGDLCSRKGALTGGFVDVSKSRLRAYARQIEAQETLRTVERDYNDMKRKAQEVDQGIQNLMQELQRLEAKQAELNHTVAAKESDLDRLESRLENHKKQIETIEKTTIPPLERNITDLDGDLKRLQEEMGTELQQTLTSKDRERLVVLKELQESLASKIEAQQEIVDAAGLAKQKLQSLLENNLLKRRRELTEGVADEGSNRRASRGRMSTDAVQAQRKEDLEERKRERDTAARAMDDVEARVEEARKVEAELRKALHAAKNELEQLRGEDMQNVKAWEDAQDKSERFLTKVRCPRGRPELHLADLSDLFLISLSLSIK